MSDHDNTPRGEYTRIKAKVQLGDGPDQRGEVTVEMVRERTEDTPLDVRTVELPDGTSVETTIDDRTFAEFYLESGRVVSALSDRLGLDPDDAEVYDS